MGTALSTTPAVDQTERAPADNGATRRFWNANAADWHRSDSQLGDTDHRRIAELLGVQTGARILDAGCGTGRRARTLQAAGVDVVAADVADAMVAYASQAAPGRVVQADVSRLPFRGGTFDAALCAYVLDFVRDPVPVLRELRRTVKDHGRLLVDTAGAVRGPRRHSWRRFLGEPQQTVGPLPWEVEPLLALTGWRVVYEEGVFGHDRDGVPNPVTDPTAVDPATWKVALQALADGWRILAVAR